MVLPLVGKYTEKAAVCQHLLYYFRQTLRLIIGWPPHVQGGQTMINEAAMFFTTCVFHKSYYLFFFTLNLLCREGRSGMQGLSVLLSSHRSHSLCSNTLEHRLITWPLQFLLHLHLMSEITARKETHRARCAWCGRVGAALGSYWSHESGFAALPKCLAAGRHNYILQLVEASFRLRYKQIHLGIGADYQFALCGSHFA